MDELKEKLMVVLKQRNVLNAIFAQAQTNLFQTENQNVKNIFQRLIDSKTIDNDEETNLYREGLIKYELCLFTRIDSLKLTDKTLLEPLGTIDKTAAELFANDFIIACTLLDSENLKYSYTSEEIESLKLLGEAIIRKEKYIDSVDKVSKLGDMHKIFKEPNVREN